MPADSATSRRQFPVASAEIRLGIAALTSTGGLAAPRRVIGTYERVRLAVCDIRKRGFDHVRLSSQFPNVTVVALGDVDENVLRERLVEMEKPGRPKP